MVDRSGTGPVRYKGKKRRDAPTARLIDLDEPAEEFEPLEEDAIDPLDAQRAGMHDEAFEMGHEEVSLNLEDHPAPAEHEHEIEASTDERPAAAEHE